MTTMSPSSASRKSRRTDGAPAKGQPQARQFHLGSHQPRQRRSRGTRSELESARFVGLQTARCRRARRTDCLELHYAADTKLFLAFAKYRAAVALRSITPTSNSIGWRQGWQARKQKLRRTTAEARRTRLIIESPPPRHLIEAPKNAGATDVYDEFCRAISMDETEDQLGERRSMTTCTTHLGPPPSSSSMMWRGDMTLFRDGRFSWPIVTQPKTSLLDPVISTVLCVVRKTEPVALRRTFEGFALDGKQSAIVVPTTLLARQH